MSSPATAGLALLLSAACLVWPALGQEKSAQSSPAAVQRYRDAANFQNNNAFELAAEEWQKFLKDFPADPLAAKAQHYLGVCQFQLKQFEPAATTLQKLLKDQPKFEQREDALFTLGSCQYSLSASGKSEQYAQAAQTFAALLTDFPKSRHAEEALYFQGEAQYAQGKKAEAAAAYERLLKEHDKGKRRGDALYALGVAQEELGKFAEAGQTYDAYLKDFAELPLAREVRMRKAETLLQAGDVVAAEKLFGEAAATTDFAAADHALSRQAFCLAKLNKFAEAGTLYARLATDYSNSPAAADAALAAGRSFYRADKPSEAQPWFEKAVAKGDAGSTEAAHWLCRILIKGGKAAEAAELAGKQLAAAKDKPFAANLEFDRADALYDVAGKRNEALALYAAFAAKHAQHELAPQALYNAAFAALDLKQYEDGLKHTASFLAAHPQDKLAADVKYVAAECNVQLKKYDAAERLFRELAEQHAAHPDSDAWRVRLGLVAYLDKRYDAAISSLAPIAAKLKSAEHQAEAQFVIGASQFFADKPAEAAKALTASLAASAKWKQSDEALLLLARAQSKLGKSDESKTNLQKLIAEYSQSDLLDQAHFRLGELAQAAGDYPAAIAAYQSVVSRFPASNFVPYSLYWQGWSQLKSKDYKSGVTSFTALLTKYPEHELKADAKYGRAVCRRQTGDFAGAIADLDEYLAAKLEPAQQSEARYQRGLAQVGAGDFAGAVATLEGLLKADPKYAGADQVLYEIGWALKSHNKHAEAAAAFAKLSADHPNSALTAEAAFHVGEDQYDKKQYAEAARSYAVAKAKSPGGELGEKAVYKLGWSEFQQRKYAEALTHFREQLAAFGQGPLAPDAVFMEAECLFRQEKFKEAWPAYQAALKSKASSEPIEVLTLLHGGQSAAQLKQWDESVKVLALIPTKFAQSPLVPEALYELGWAKQNLDQSDEALTHYEAAATQSRDHVGARARFMRGELLFGQKKHDEASKDFQRSMFGYGGEQATAETKHWQAKSGYEAGRCAEAQITSAPNPEAKQKHIADALRFYTFVAEKHASHELAAEAKKRLAVLTKL